MCLMNSCSDVYGGDYETWPLTCFRPYASYTKGCTYDKCSCDCCCHCGCRKVNGDCRDGYGDRGEAGLPGPPRRAAPAARGRRRPPARPPRPSPCLLRLPPPPLAPTLSAGCFCAREADTKGRTYDRGVGSFPTGRTKKTVTMATLPVVSFPQ